MRRLTQNWKSGHLINMASNIWRRQGWFTENATLPQMTNLFVAGTQFLLKQQKMRAWPALVKIDISPLCNIRCTYCVHANPNDSPSLAAQSFKARDKMSLEQFAAITHEISGKSMAVSLYYLGDSLVHPQLDEMCGVARAARLNVHISTNFSFNLSDERLHSLVNSGLTHLTVCVDSLQQERYERTRVGGRIAVVLDNLARLLEIRRSLGQVYPKVEVQFIKFQHNLDELEAAATWCEAQGVDQFTDYWGNLHNYVDTAPDNVEVYEPHPNRLLPQCTWPHFAMQIKYNGDVIPCCYYREAEQYRPDGDSRIVGNVFEQSVWDVWNSVHYRQLRQMVANPQSHATDPAYADTFCQGCPTIFETDVKQKRVTGEQRQWEDLYMHNDKNVVVRR